MTYEPYICDECGAFVAKSRKALHKGEHDALIEVLHLMLAKVKALSNEIEILRKKADSHDH